MYKQKWDKMFKIKIKHLPTANKTNEIQRKMFQKFSALGVLQAWK